MLFLVLSHFEYSKIEALTNVRQVQHEFTISCEFIIVLDTIEVTTEPTGLVSEFFVHLHL